MLGLMTTPRVLSSLILVGALFAPTAHAAADQTRFDLFKQVQQQVLRYAYYTVFDDINIAVAEDGTVTLTGSVTGGHKKDGIERRVARIDGVTRVNNEIELLPVSSNDDQLRRLVARAIYGNPNFGRYGATVNPSIHIIVNGGHVTLTGVVMSEVDRRLARLLAGRFHAFSVTNELRLPDEVTAELEQLG